MEFCIINGKIVSFDFFYILYYIKVRYRNIISWRKKVDLNEFDYHNSFVPPESDIGLNMMLRWAGHQRTENKDYSFNGMRRGSQEFVLWQYTISGCGQIESDEGSFLIPPGCAFLLTIPDKHRYFLPSGHWEFLYLGFNGSEALRIARELRAKYSPVSSAFASPQAIAAAKMFLRRGDGD